MIKEFSAAFGLGDLSDYNTDKGLVIIYDCYKYIGFAIRCICSECFDCD